MTSPTPRLHCRPRAFEQFALQIPAIDTSGGEGLMAAAIAISMHELENADPAGIEVQLQQFADTVASRVPHAVDQLRKQQPVDPEPVLAHLHSVLFDECQFRGNMNDYYNPRNSYIPAVVESRRGIPITLTMIYKNVAERLGLTVHGINAPGHFLAAIDPPRNPNTPQGVCTRMYIDPFCGGRVLNKQEVYELLEQTLGRPVPCDRNVLSPASNRQWLNRMLQNLQNIFAFTRRDADLAAMQEMTALLQR